MEAAADAKYNVGYIKILPKDKVSYSIEFEKNFVADFDEDDNLVGIELLDAAAYKPRELQNLMAKAKAAALEQRGFNGSGPMVERSA